MPSNYPGGLHAYREDLVFQRFRSAWTSYSKLRAQSIVARYLSTTQRVFLQKPVEDHYSEQDVRNFVYRDLDKIRRKLGF